jgi:hypothetical protein
VSFPSLGLVLGEWDEGADECRFGVTELAKTLAQDEEAGHGIPEESKKQDIEVQESTADVQQQQQQQAEDKELHI